MMNIRLNRPGNLSMPKNDDIDVISREFSIAEDYSGVGSAINSKKSFFIHRSKERSYSHVKKTVKVNFNEKYAFLRNKKPLLSTPMCQHSSYARSIKQEKKAVTPVRDMREKFFNTHVNWTSKVRRVSNKDPNAFDPEKFEKALITDGKTVTRRPQPLHYNSGGAGVSNTDGLAKMKRNRFFNNFVHLHAHHQT